MNRASRPFSRPTLLSALRFFDAVMRHRSFTDAAAELGVTQTAVSHRIKDLESALGISLFHRTTRHLDTTDEGVMLGDAVRGALTTIEQAIDAAMRSRASGEIVVSAPSAFTVKWLIPRLGVFNRQHPGIAVSVLAEDHLIDLRARTADVAIRFGPGPYPGNHVTRLAADTLFPVLSPALAARLGAKPQAHDLVKLGILADSVGERNGTGYTWDCWAAGSGIDPKALKPRRYFNRSDLMIQAAIAGQGVALGRMFLTIADISNKFLAAPIGPRVRMKSVYHLVTLPEKANAEKIRRFREWLLEQMSETDRAARQILTGEEAQGGRAARASSKQASPRTTIS